MNKSTISIRNTAAFSTIFVDYVEGNSSLVPFYKYKPELAAFKQAIEDKSKENINRQLLVDVLEKQYSESGIQHSELSIQQLLNPTTFTVCTGHQLCMFTGPLYFIYKLITTINLSEQLKKSYPSYNFVPIYWMASEDHDFEEVNHVNVFGKKISWDKAVAVGDKKIPIGYVETKTLTTLIGELKTILGETDNAKELITLFEKAYLGNDNLAAATRFLVHELFGKHGLLIIDANDAGLKKQFSEIVKDDLLNHTNYQLVNSSVQQLADLNYKSQVNPRMYNCFYLKGGERKRIVEKGEVTDTNVEVEFTDSMLLEVDTNPEYFSPNVVLRPLYQQKILPNLAYVGGPGELAYWLEYKAMFEHHNINFPVLIPRNFAMLVDAKSAKQWSKLGFEQADYFRDSNTLIKEFVLKNSKADLSLEMEQQQLEDVYKKMTAKVEAVDPSLKASVLADQQKAINALKAIEGKLVKAEKQKNEVLNAQIKKIKLKLFPEEVLQERHDNFIPYYLIYGNGFIDLLKKEFSAFDKNLIVLSE